MAGGFRQRGGGGAVRVLVMIGRAAVHHLEHRAGAGAEETHHQRGGQQQEDDVEHRGVVPLDGDLGDFRVPLGQGLQLFTALQLQKVPSKILIFPDEGHWVLKPQNSQLWYKTVNDWVDQWTNHSR